MLAAPVRSVELKMSSLMLMATTMKVSNVLPILTNRDHLHQLRATNLAKTTFPRNQTPGTAFGDRLKSRRTQILTARMTASDPRTNEKLRTGQCNKWAGKKANHSV